jgi:hypothetical protein
MFDSMEEAFSYGKSKCFDFQVSYGEQLVGYWSVIGGTKIY